MNSSESVWFHGTNHQNVDSILATGFADRWPDDDDSEPGEPPGMYGGHLGNGIYVTQNLVTASWYGPAVLRVQLQPGTRLAFVNAAPRTRTINYLVREFGRELVAGSRPLKAVPQSKRLTDAELIELLRYHYQRCWERNWDSPSGEFRWPTKRDRHWRAQLSLASELRRRGYHGYGDPNEEMGVVIFDVKRIEVLGLEPMEAPAHIKDLALHP